MRHWVPRAAYALVALAVAGPMLAKGLVLAVDLAPVPHPHLATDYWGIPSGTHSGPVDRLPIDLLFAAAGHIGAVALLEKLLLLASIFLAGLGMHRLAPTDDEVGPLLRRAAVRGQPLRLRPPLHGTVVPRARVRPAALGVPGVPAARSG